MARKLNLLLIFLLLMISCNQKSLKDGHIIYEQEPNDEPLPNGTPLQEGIIYSGNIFNNKSIFTPDKDVFKIDSHLGRVVTIEFETDNTQFQPVVAVFNQYDLSKYVIPSGGNKHTFNVFPAYNGSLYLYIDDIRNVEGNYANDKEFQYWFRIKTQNICDMDPGEPLTLEKTIQFNMNEDKGLFKQAKLNNPNGHYALYAETKNGQSDRKMLIYDCFGDEVYRGNDDIDVYSELTDPYIYTYFGGTHDFRIIIDNWITDFTTDDADQFMLSLRKQQEGTEFENNDMVDYANELLTDTMEGQLSYKEYLIEGDLRWDTDIFKRQINAGTIYEVTLTSGGAGEFLSDFYTFALNDLGAAIYPLKLSYIETETDTTHIFNTFVPFNGIVYFLLEAQNMFIYEQPLPYTFTVKNYLPQEELTHGETTVLENSGCGSVFANYQFPQDIDMIKIETVNSKDAALYIYKQKGEPVVYVEPETGGYFYLNKDIAADNIVVASFPAKCNEEQGNIAEISITEIPLNPIDLEFSDETPKEIATEGTYIGYFNTDNLYVTNNYQITPETAATISITTGPWKTVGDFDIDTMVSVKDEQGNTIASNDDMIDMFSFNGYSYIRFAVDAQETYTIKVTPFMDESSNISAMNIIGNYILDIHKD